MFTKQHYNAIANILKYGANRRYFIDGFVTMFGQDNPQFDRERFIKACDIRKPPKPK